MATDTATRPTDTPTTHERPQIGGRVWYRRAASFFGEWVSATVVDRTDDDGMGTIVTIYRPARNGTLHLRIDLDPERHCSGESTAGFRLHVAEGTGYGQWQRECPATAEADYQTAITRAEMKKELYLEQARERAGLSN